MLATSSFQIQNQIEVTKMSNETWMWIFLNLLLPIIMLMYAIHVN